MLLLPDGSCGFELIDEEAGGLERIRAVGRADDDGHRGFTNLDPAHPMLHSDTDQRPGCSRLRNQLGDLGLNHLEIGLVDQVGDSGFARRVVPNHAEKGHDGTGAWIEDAIEEGCGIKRCFRNTHVVPMSFCTHTIDDNARS